MWLALVRYIFWLQIINFDYCKAKSQNHFFSSRSQVLRRILQNVKVLHLIAVSKNRKGFYFESHTWWKTTKLVALSSGGFICVCFWTFHLIHRLRNFIFVCVTWSLVKSDILTLFMTRDSSLLGQQDTFNLRYISAVPHSKVTIVYFFLLKTNIKKPWNNSFYCLL